VVVGSNMNTQCTMYLENDGTSQETIINNEYGIQECCFGIQRTFSSTHNYYYILYPKPPLEVKEINREEFILTHHIFHLVVSF
jgi:hypothetical protein